MNLKTMLPLILLALIFTISQAHAESGGTPLRLAWKLLHFLIADAKMLVRASQLGSALQSPDAIVAVRLLCSW